MSAAMKRLSWALALSIGLNLFLLGFGVVRLAHHRHPEGASGPHGRMGELLGPPTPALREERKVLTDARRRVGEALAAEPYDPDALSEALAALRESTSRGQEKLHERLIERAGQLSPEERRAFAERRFLRERGGGERD